MLSILFNRLKAVLSYRDMFRFLTSTSVRRFSSCNYRPPPPENPWPMIFTTVFAASLLSLGFTNQLNHQSERLHQRMDRMETQIKELFRPL